MAPTIREKLNTYRFAEHKEKVIDVLKRLCTVSVRTAEVIRGLSRSTHSGARVFRESLSPVGLWPSAHGYARWWYRAE